MPNIPLITAVALDSKMRTAELTFAGGTQIHTEGGGICPDDYANIVTVIGGIGRYDQPRILVLGDQSYLIDNATVGKIT